MRGTTRQRVLVRHVLPAVLGLAAALGMTIAASTTALAPLSQDELSKIATYGQYGEDSLRTGP